MYGEASAGRSEELVKSRLPSQCLQRLAPGSPWGVVLTGMVLRRVGHLLAGRRSVSGRAGPAGEELLGLGPGTWRRCDSATLRTVRGRTLAVAGSGQRATGGVAAPGRHREPFGRPSGVASAERFYFPSPSRRSARNVARFARRTVCCR